MRLTLTRRWAVPAVWAAALSAGAAYSYARYTAEWGVIQERLNAKPGLTRVDLSHAGSVVVPIPRSPGVHHHGQTFYLELGDGAAPDRADRLKGLRGEVRVVDDKGAEVFRVPLGEGLGTDTAGPNRYSLGYTGAMPSDGYTMTITVETGSPDLAGVESMVYARYAICELEAMPAMLWGLLAWLAGVPATLLWVIVAVRSVRWPASRARVPAGINQS